MQIIRLFADLNRQLVILNLPLVRFSRNARPYRVQLVCEMHLGKVSQPTLRILCVAILFVLLAGEHEERSDCKNCPGDRRLAGVFEIQDYG